MSMPTRTACGEDVTTAADMSGQSEAAENLSANRRSTPAGPVRAPMACRTAETAASPDAARRRGSCHTHDMTEVGRMQTVTLTEPAFKGSYRVLERRQDGTLVLQPEHEKLSQ